MRSSFPPLLLLLALAAALAGGCGGGDDGDGASAEDQIREVVSQSLTTHNPERDCNEWLSDALIERSYQTRERCERLQADDEDEQAEEVEFERIRVNGDSATAEITVIGGDTDGLTGSLGLVREDGAWRMDELSVSLLRDLVSLGLSKAGLGDDLPRAAVGCFEQQLDRMPDPEFERLAYQMVGETEPAKQRTIELLGECRDDEGRSYLRAAFEEGVEEGLRENGAGDAEVQCVVERLRRGVSDEQLVELLSSPDANEAAARELGPLVQACEAASSS